MLTVDYDRLGVAPGDRLLDLGCGAGRHAFEAYRRGAHVVALDYDRDELAGVAGLLGAMKVEGEAPQDASAAPANGDACRLPFPDASFDRVIASEVLEHIPDDENALRELVRVLRPGGTMAVTVPAWLAERICWAISDEYHAPKAVGGHLRIYTESTLRAKMAAAGLDTGGSHKTHGLHSPYWWLRCAVGVHDDHHPLTRAYHRLLVWDMTHAPLLTRTTERLLNPIIGKSIVIYATKPVGTAPTSGHHRAATHEETAHVAA